MKRSLRLALLLVTAANLTIGCGQTIKRTMIRGQLPQLIEEEYGEFVVVSATLVDGETVIFDRKGGAWEADSTTVAEEYDGAFVGVDTAGIERRLPIGEMAEAQVEYTEPSLAVSTTSATTVITITLYLVVVAAFSGGGHL